MFKLVNKKILISFIIGILFIVIGLSYFVGVKFFNQPLTNIPIEDVVLSEEIMENGITLELLSSTVSESDVITKTFTYSVIPENATNQSITARATYTNESDCSEYLTVEVNEETKTVTVYCYKDFNSIILIRLISVSNKAATATITVNYEKKVKSIEQNYNGLVGGGMLINLPNNLLRSYYIMKIVTPIYSNYTIDKKYEFTESHTLPVLNLVEGQYMNDDLRLKLTNMVDNWIKSGYYSFTNGVVWNLSDEDSWHEYLSEISNKPEEECVFKENDKYVYKFTSDITYKYGDKELIIPTSLYISLYHDYSDYIEIIDVESLTVENSNIIF